MANCKVVEIRPGASHEPIDAIICSRGGSKPRCWPCAKLNRKRDSVALCDGPAPLGAALKRKSETCDVPLCGEHAHRVGPNRDLCPACLARASVSGEANLPGEPDDEIATMTPEGAPLTLFDVATDPRARRAF